MGTLECRGTQEQNRLACGPRDARDRGLTPAWIASSRPSFEPKRRVGRLVADVDSSQHRVNSTGSPSTPLAERAVGNARGCWERRCEVPSGAAARSAAWSSFESRLASSYRQERHVDPTAADLNRRCNIHEIGIVACVVCCATTVVRVRDRDGVRRPERRAPRPRVLSASRPMRDLDDVGAVRRRVGREVGTTPSSWARLPNGLAICRRAAGAAGSIASLGPRRPDTERSEPI
jgi:hypothetical protein